MVHRGCLGRTVCVPTATLPPYYWIWNQIHKYKGGRQVLWETVNIFLTTIKRFLPRKRWRRISSLRGTRHCGSSRRSCCKPPEKGKHIFLWWGHAQKMFARRNAHSLTGKQLNIFGHFTIEYVCAWYHALAQLNASSTQAHAHESVVLTHLQLEASSIHAHVQKCPLLPRAPCAAEGHTNPMRMRSKVLIASYVQQKGTSTPCACAAKCASQLKASSITFTCAASASRLIRMSSCCLSFG